MVNGPAGRDVNGRKTFARARPRRYRHLVCLTAERALDRSKSGGSGGAVATGVRLERIRRLETAKIITGYQAIVDIAALSRPINVFAEIILERQARQVGFERHLARIDNVVECWEVGGTVDYIARFVCPDLALYEELTKELIEDDALGVARIISHVALRPIRRFTGYPDSLLTRHGG
jgi:DNA-binding Lrp family transcriptional regulator